MEDILWPLEKVLYIYHLFCFQKDYYETKAFIDLSSKINVITPAYAAKLSFKVQKTDIEAQKIDSSIFDTFEMVLAKFQVEDKLGRVWFF